jgi:hypothetical protein
MITRTVLLWIIFAGVVGFAFGGSFVWSFQQPAQTQNVHNTDTPTNGATNDHQPAKPLRQRLSVIWERTWEDPVAFYTFVLGIFTALLAIVSATQIYFLIRADKTARISADAAALNAKAAIVIELPIIIFRLQLHRQLAVMDPVDGVPGNKSELRIFLDNRGRSAAEMLELVVGWKVIKALPEKPVSERTFQFAPGDLLEAEGNNMRSVVIELQNEEIESIRNNTASLWAYGHLLYKDFLGASHQTPYCAKWYPFEDTSSGYRVPARFIYDPSNPPEYIKKT